MISHLSALAAHAYYAGELAVGRRACERLLKMPELPEGLEALTRRNRSWYTQRLDELVATRFVRLDVEPADAGWSLFNPSVVARDGGYVCNVRSSNYRIVDGRYVMPESDVGMIKTKNVLLDLARDLTVIGRPEVISAEYEATDYPVDGLEDVRLNLIDGELVASATLRNFASLDGTCRIGTASVCRHSRQYRNISVIETESGRHEKNWMPIVGQRKWIYACHAQGRVATATPDSGAWLIELRGEAPPVARGFRGGSQLVDIGGGLLLAIVHEVCTDTDGRRIYEHRFVAFHDSDYAIAAISPAFVFRESRAIEFAAGMARQVGQLVVSFGVRDCEAWLVELRLTELLPLLEPVA